MSKSITVARALPPVARNALRQLGENIAIARARRKESQRTWADRIGISVPTLIRLEQGEPSVSMAAYASALWLIGRVQSLGEIAAPVNDVGALEQDVRKARQRGATRHATSISVRLDESDERPQ